MIGDIGKLLAIRPFEPFSVVTNAGMRYRVASPDHINFTPRKTRVVILFDDETTVVISALHIASVEIEATQSA